MFGFILNLIRNRNFLWIAGIFLLSIIFIAIPLDIKTSISTAVINTLYFPLTAFDGFLNDIATAKKQNILLNQKLAELSVQVASFAEERAENARLRKMLDFNIHMPYTLVPAKVIGIGNNPNAKSILINVGANRGVRVNNPVVTADGIVGKTIAVTQNSCMVQLLTDHNCRVSAIDQNTRTQGIIRWRGGKLLQMGEVPVESQLAVGDTIVSSGFGGIFPPGIQVGTVVYAKNQTGSLFKEILVKPAVQFWSLEEVFVILYGQ
ncbi:MAG: rod shape-determining protein MreC [candidate division Zixibacteria bacterium]|nr:rod shape-determining protein MreC [candidate division Zixibacteria bacterium]